MPGRDGTGPMGAGPMTGRGFEICTGANAVRYGAAVYEISPKTQEELLKEQKTILQERLEAIDQQLENL